MQPIATGSVLLIAALLCRGEPDAAPCAILGLPKCIEKDKPFTTDVLVQSNGQPVSGAQVQVGSTGIPVPTNASGVASITLPASQEGSTLLTSVTVGGMPCATPVATTAKKKDCNGNWVINVNVNASLVHVGLGQFVEQSFGLTAGEFVILLPPASSVDADVSFVETSPGTFTGTFEAMAVEYPPAGDRDGAPPGIVATLYPSDQNLISVDTTTGYASGVLRLGVLGAGFPPGAVSTFIFEGTYADGLLTLAIAGFSGLTCGGDLNADGIVDGADLGAVLGGWGSAGPTDLDANGTTDGADLGLLLAAWGWCDKT